MERRKQAPALIAAGVVAAGFLIAGGVGVWAAAGGAFPGAPIAKRFGVIEEGKVYRAGALTPASLERVHEKYHVKTVVDLGGHHEGSKGDAAEAEAAKKLGIERHVFRLEGDGTGDPNFYVEALRLITDPTKQPVIVHCGAGSQRAGAMTMLYRMAVEGKPALETYPEAWKYDHKAGKDWRMLAYVADWNDEIVKAWREGGAVEVGEAVGQSAGAPAETKSEKAGAAHEPDAGAKPRK